MKGGIVRVVRVLLIDRSSMAAGHAMLCMLMHCALCFSLAPSSAHVPVPSARLDAAASKVSHPYQCRPIPRSSYDFSHDVLVRIRNGTSCPLLFFCFKNVCLIRVVDRSLLMSNFLHNFSHIFLTVRSKSKSTYV